MENTTGECDGVYLLPNESSTDFLKYGIWPRILITIIMPCILAIGLTGNIIFILVLYRVCWMRSDITVYLLNIAVADILFLVSTVGEKLWMYLTSPYLYDVSGIGPVACFIFYPVQAMSYFSSIALVTVISYERLQAVCEPMGKIMTRQKHHCKRLAVCAWILGGAFSCLLIPGKSVVTRYCIQFESNSTYYYNPGENATSSAGSSPAEEGAAEPVVYFDTMIMCEPLWTWSATFANCLQTVPFFIAMVANSIMYLRIVRALQRSNVNANTNDLRERTLRDRNKVTRMLVANGIIFFLCLAPFQTASLLRAFFYLDSFHVEVASSILLYLNSAVNPIVYNCTNSRYRMAFRLAFKSGAVNARARRFRSVLSMEEYRQSSHAVL